MKTDRQKVICFGLICLLSYDIIASNRSLGDSLENSNPQHKGDQGGDPPQEEFNPQLQASYGESQLHKETQERISRLKETVEKTDKQIGEINKALLDLKKEKDGNYKDKTELNKKKEELRKETDKILENLNELYQKLSQLESNNIVKDPESIAAQKKEIEQYIHQLKAEQELDRRLGDIKERLDRAESLSPNELQVLKEDIVQLRNNLLNTIESSNSSGILDHRFEDRVTDSLAALDRNEKILENLSQSKTSTPFGDTPTKLYTHNEAPDSSENSHGSYTEISYPSETSIAPKQRENFTNNTNSSNSPVPNSLNLMKPSSPPNLPSNLFRSEQKDFDGPFASSNKIFPSLDSFNEPKRYANTGESTVNSSTNMNSSPPASEQPNIKAQNFRSFQSENPKSNLNLEDLSLWKKESLYIAGIRRNVTYAMSNNAGLEEEAANKTGNIKLKEPLSFGKGDSNQNTNVQYEIVDLSGNFAVSQPKYQQSNSQANRRGLASIEVSETPSIKIETTPPNLTIRGLSEAIEGVRNLKDSSNNKPTSFNKTLEPIDLFLPTVSTEITPASDITELITPKFARKITMKSKMGERLFSAQSSSIVKENHQAATKLGLWQRFKTKILSWF